MKLPKWINGSFQKNNRWKVKDASDVPKNVASNTLYKIYNGDCCWQILMLCPCGCKTVLYLNALQEYKPSWKIVKNKKAEISIYPSINRQEGCCSHFFIKNSKTQWV